MRPESTSRPPVWPVLGRLLFRQLLFKLAGLGVQLVQLAEVVVGEGYGVLDEGDCRAAQSAGVWVAARIEHAAHGPELTRDVTIPARDRSQIGIAAAIQLLQVCYHAP